MTLSPGAHLGPYEILGLIGEGGRGEVFRARDLRLGRMVAIKALHERFSERFGREARAIAQLNHPNICTLYDVGPDYLVMECIEGQTLKEKLAAGPLQLDEVLDIAWQVSQGLRAAHQRGILHQNIKPANVLVASDGQVKLTDFGMAEFSYSAEGETEAVPLAVPGAVMGTPAYTSPEQARGKMADQHSDIWSLGVVLYEMASGQSPFQGESATTVLRAILDEEPQPLSRLRPGVPPELERIVAKMLAKDPRARYPQVEELIADLKQLREQAGAPSRPARGRQLLYIGAGAAVLLVTIVGAILFSRSSKFFQSSPPSPGINQRSVWLHENGQDRRISSERDALLPAWGDGFPTSVFSPGGQRLYYLVQTAGGHRFGGGELWFSDLASSSNVPLLPGLVMTTFDLSPDGQRLVYAAIGPDGKSRIWLAPVDGRSPPRALPPPEAKGPVFGGENEVYYRAPEGEQWYIFEIKLDSGQVRKFTSEPAMNSPIVSPDGQWIVSWTSAGTAGPSGIVKAYAKDSGVPIVLCQGCFVKWTRDRQSLFLSFQSGNFIGDGKTFVIALPPGKTLPALPPQGVNSEADLKKLPITGVIDNPNAFPGVTASTYAFEKRFVQRN